MIRTNGRFKETRVSTWARGAGRASGERGSFLLPKVFGNWSGTRETFQMDGKGGNRWFHKSLDLKECQHTLPSNPASLNYSEPLLTSYNSPLD